MKKLLGTIVVLFVFFGLTAIAPTEVRASDNTHDAIEEEFTVGVVLDLFGANLTNHHHLFEFAFYYNNVRLDQQIPCSWGSVTFTGKGSTDNYSVYALRFNRFTTERTRVPVSEIRFSDILDMYLYGWIFEYDPSAVVTQPPNTLGVIGVQNPRIELRGSVIPDTEAVIIDGTTLVPVRVISEEMGAEVGWDEANWQVTISFGGNTVVLTIDSVQVEGHDDLLHPAILIDSRTFVPLRFLGENVLGLEVFWRPY